MRRLFFLLLFSTLQLCAQQELGNAAAETEETSQSSTGTAAAEAVDTSQNSNWQNWVFAGSALVTATIGVVIISLTSGTTSH